MNKLAVLDFTGQLETCHCASELPLQEPQSFQKPVFHCQVTYKVFFGAQSLPLVLVEKGLQEVTGSHRPTPGDLQRLVQNVLIHLGYVLAVEGRLVREGES